MRLSRALCIGVAAVVSAGCFNYSDGNQCRTSADCFNSGYCIAQKCEAPAGRTVAVSVATPAVSIAVGGHQQLTAQVEGVAEQGVSWSVQESSLGGIDPSGLFTAAASGTVHVVATSVADTTKSATVAVAVPVVAIAVAPLTSTVIVGATQQFTATAINAVNTAVTWSVQENNFGSINSSGLFTAVAAGTVHVVATSVADTTKSATVFAIVANPAASLSFASQPATGVSGANLTTIRVNVLDAQGNLTLAPTQVNVSLIGGAAGATLSGTTIQPASAGVATFGDLTVAVPADSYQLQAGAHGLPNATSTAFAITCLNNGPFVLGGSVTGLAGTGLVLRTAGEADLSLSSGATNFAFPTAVVPTTAYSVAVQTQPTAPNQLCTVANGSADVACNNVSSILVTCVDAFQLAGAISGLTGGGLQLQTPGQHPLNVPAGATTFTVPALLPRGAAYAVSVAAQPTSPWQTCVVTDGSGSLTADVSAIDVTCTTNTYPLAGNISGLFGAGLTLSAAGEPDLVIKSSAQTFAFPNQLASGASWSITVTQQPDSSLICTPAPASGTVGGAANSAITCTCPSGTSCAPEWADWPIPPYAPIDYTDNKDGTVTDHVTGLVWQQAPAPSTYTQAAAGIYCRALSLGGFSTGWRLPSLIELFSIVDDTRYGPSINATFFPTTPAKGFWSSSPYVAIAGNYWAVGFDLGSTFYVDAAGGSGNVRCVR